MAYTPINKSSDYFNTLLWTGNGVDNRSITGVGFQPDWTWIKSRSNTDYHMIADAVRGDNKQVKTNSTDDQDSDTNKIKSFNSDGFTIGTGTVVNRSGATFVSWNLKANGAGSANTAGSINSTVSVNTTSGFSIVKYTGNATVSTIGHGLGVAPKMIITKNLSRSEAWPVDCRQGNDGAGGIMYLNETGTLGAYGNGNPYPSTAPTSTVYSVGTAGNTNYSGSELIAYCFAEKTGFSKFGQYKGNGSATNGTFIYTGFKPAMIIIKRSDTSAGQWTIFDNKRNPNNEVRAMLVPNGTDVELSQNENNMDFLSNGLKMYNSDGVFNASGSKYIYMAFAEAPLVGTNNIPANAR